VFDLDALLSPDKLSAEEIEKYWDDVLHLKVGMYCLCVHRLCSVPRMEGLSCVAYRASDVTDGALVRVQEPCTCICTSHLLSQLQLTYTCCSNCTRTCLLCGACTHLCPLLTSAPALPPAAPTGTCTHICTHICTLLTCSANLHLLSHLDPSPAPALQPAGYDRMADGLWDKVLKAGIATSRK
jgi:hypothetical protein